MCVSENLGPRLLRRSCSPTSFWTLVVALLSAASAGAAPIKLGAMGDSLTDEYWDSGTATYATNWAELVVNFRAVNMGPTAAQAGTNTWGSPRNAGFKYNWALSGATTASLLTEGQHTGLSNQVSSESISSAVLAIGPNDFSPTGGSYFSIYSGSWSASQIQSYVNQSVSNIETALVTVRASGVSMVLANVIDPGMTPAVTSLFSSAANRDRVTAAVQSVNSGVKFLAQKYQVPLMDWYGLGKAIFGPNTNLHPTLKVGNVTINLRGSDPGPPNSAPTNAFVSDGFHPNTVPQGIIANLVLQALDSGYNAGLPLFSEQEILNHALIAYGGSDTLQAQIGPYTNYIVLPTRPQFTGISVAGTNVTLKLLTVSNQFYVVESRDDLALGSWATLSNNLAGTGGVVSLTNRVSSSNSKRFYRARQLP
jgi:lysophospholipase L1-like esterase